MHESLGLEVFEPLAPYREKAAEGLEAFQRFCPQPVFVVSPFTTLEDSTFHTVSLKDLAELGGGLSLVRIQKRPGANEFKSVITLGRAQTNDLRFKAEGTTTSVYPKGLLSTLGLGQGNVVRSAINLSEGGVLLLANEQMKPDTLVRVRVEIKSPPDVLEGDGIVRWCAASRNRPDQFYVGIQFQELKAAQTVKLSRMREWFSSPAFRMKEATRRSSHGIS